MPSGFSSSFQSSADNFLLDCGGLSLFSSSDSAQNFHADVFKLIGNFRDLIGKQITRCVSFWMKYSIQLL